MQDTQFRCQQETRLPQGFSTESRNPVRLPSIPERADTAASTFCLCLEPDFWFSLCRAMNRKLRILTNLAFRESPAWREATATICESGESPDTLGVLRQTFRLLRLQSRFDVVLTMGPRPSLLYGLLCGILGRPSKQIMMEVFLDTERPRSPVWRFKTGLFRWIANRSLGILTNSSGEVELISKRFDLPRQRLRFVPMYSTIEHPGLRDQNDGTVVSVGRTLRDLDTLLKAAGDIQAPVVVVAGRTDPAPASLPSNVRFLREIPLEEAHRLLSRAAVVILPLVPAHRSTGQVVLFEAMAMGKPVVATRVIGTVDYIRPGQNGLLVEPGNPQTLAAAVNRILEDPALADQLSRNALRDCVETLNIPAYADRLLQAIGDLFNLSASSPAS